MELYNEIKSKTNKYSNNKIFFMCAYPWGTPVKFREDITPQQIDSFLDLSVELRKFWCLQRQRTNHEQVNNTRHGKYDQ